MTDFKLHKRLFQKAVYLVLAFFVVLSYLYVPLNLDLRFRDHYLTIATPKVPKAHATISEVAKSADTTLSATSYTLVDSMTLTPGAGDYLAVFNMSVMFPDPAGAEMFYVSIFVNGVQQTYTERELYAETSLDGAVMPIATHAHISVGAGQTVEVRYYKSGTGNFTGKNRRLILFPKDSGDFSQVTATADSTVTPGDANYVALNSMSTTPGAGDYLAVFSASGSGDSGAVLGYSLFVNGSQIAHTERTATMESSIPNTDMSFLIAAKVSPAAGQTVEVKWARKGGTGSITTHERTLTLMKVNSSDIFEASSTSDSSASNTADATINSMSIAPGTAATYLAIFSGSDYYGTIGSNQNTTYSIYKDSTQASSSEIIAMHEASVDSADMPAFTEATTTLTGGSETVTAQWRGSSSASRTVHERTLVLIKEAAVALTVTNSTGESSVTADSATLNGNITATGGENANGRGFAWGTESDLSGGDTATTTNWGDYGTGTFSEGVSSLTCNTNYYYRAWAQNSTGTSTSASIEPFTTSVCLSYIDISGTLYSDEGQTEIQSAGKTITVAVGTSTTPGLYSTTTIASTGFWRIESIGGPATGTPISVFVDGDSVDAFTITKASSTSNNIENVDLYQNRIIVKHEGTSATSTTIADMSFYDGSNQPGDIKFTVSGSDLTAESGQKLYIWPGDTFAPGGAVTLHGNAAAEPDGDIAIADGATFTAGGDISLAGSWLASSTAMFTPGSNTVTFTATTSKAINAQGAQFYNLTIDGTASTTGSDFGVTNTFTVNSGKMLTIGSGTFASSSPSGTVTLNGTIDGTGTLGITNNNLGTGGTLSSRVRFDATGGNITMPARLYIGVVEPYNNGATNRQVTMTGGGGGGWYSDYKYRRAIVLQNSQIATTTSTFPIVATTTQSWLKHTSLGGKIETEDGYDLVWTDESNNLLDFEVEMHSTTTGQIAHWIEAPISSTTDTTIYMYYGKSGASDLSTTTGVWDESGAYAAVWHLNEGDSTAANFYQDSTSNSKHGQLTDSNGGTIQVDGPIGKAMNFQGENNDDYISTPVIDLDQYDFTLSVWMKAETSAIYESPLTLRDDAGDAIGPQFRMEDGVGTVAWFVDCGALKKYSNYSGTNGNVYYLVGTADKDGDLSFYINGTLFESKDMSAACDGVDLTGVETEKIATNETTNASFDGIVDEPRVSLIARHAMDVLTEYNNQSDVASFMDINTASEESIGVGTYYFSSSLQPMADGTGDLIFDGASNNPTVNIAGNIDFYGTGAGDEIIWTGTGTWTASSSIIDFSAGGGGNGTFTASSTNIFILNDTTTLTSNSNSFASTTVSGALTLGDDMTISQNALLSGTIYPQSSAVKLTGAGGKSLIGGGAIGSLQVEGDYNLSNANLTVGTTTIASGGALSILADRTYTSTSTLTLEGTLDGAGTTTIQHSSLTTGGTLSSNVHFDATNGNITMPARIYGGDVEIYNNDGSSARTVTMSSGISTFSRNLNLNAANTQNITLTGSTNNPTLNATGSIDFIGGGGGTEIIDATASTNNTWNIDGNLDISGGQFTPTSGTLNLQGNYINTAGTFTHNSGTITLAGPRQQTVTGVATGTCAFNNLEITNNWGYGDATNTPSVVFNSSASTTATFTMNTASTTVVFATTTNLYTFQNIDWQGASGEPIKVRSADSYQSGGISSTDKYAWGENIGWINFGASPGDVLVGDTFVTGYAWNENIGWISMNCLNNLSCGAVNYGVSNDGSGNLSGYAWSENGGWINFNPTDSQVTIDANGDFAGMAWGENIGWIVFNCNTTSSCGTVDYKVSTEWRP